jgi:hypothetical protein
MADHERRLDAAPLAGSAWQDRQRRRNGVRPPACRSGMPARRAARLFGAAVAAAKRLQSGRLDAYLLYMLIALVAVTAVLTALA